MYSILGQQSVYLVFVNPFQQDLIVGLQSRPYRIWTIESFPDITGEQTTLCCHHSILIKLKLPGDSPSLSKSIFSDVILPHYNTVPNSFSIFNSLSCHWWDVQTYNGEMVSLLSLTQIQRLPLPVSELYKCNINLLRCAIFI